MRYSRGLSNKALKVWVEKSLPQRLLLPILSCIPDDPSALDIQLRERGVLQVYHGNTSILRIVASELGDAIQLHFDAYNSHVETSWPTLKKNGQSTKLMSPVTGCERYSPGSWLEQVRHTTGTRKRASGKTGCVTSTVAPGRPKKSGSCSIGKLSLVLRPARIGRSFMSQLFRIILPQCSHYLTRKGASGPDRRPLVVNWICSYSTGTVSWSAWN